MYSANEKIVKMPIGCPMFRHCTLILDLDLVVQLQKNDCAMCGCDCLKSKKFVSMRTCELDDIPVDSSYCIGDETKFLDIDCTAQCSSSGIR